VPQVLNASHCMAIANYIQQSTQAPTNEVRKAAEASLRACEPSAGYSDVLLAIVTSDAPPAIRLGAAILVKGLVRGAWKPSRGAAARLLSGEEKGRVRELLLGPAPRREADHSVAVQLAVLTAKAQFLFLTVVACPG
jgi:Importin-beta N-terminal domain